MPLDKYSHLAEAGKKTRWVKGDPRITKGSDALMNGDAGHKLKVTRRQFEALMESQNGVCAICHHPPKKRRLAVDHDHRTGKIRGLLCFRCNYGLSWFQDDINKFKNVITYLGGDSYSSG